MCGATIPEDLLMKLEAIQSDADAVLRCDVDHAAQQYRELLEGGAPGIHFYTLNRSTSTRNIFENLKAAGTLG
jgi:hypothetical protein